MAIRRRLVLALLAGSAMAGALHCASASSAGEAAAGAEGGSPTGAVDGDTPPSAVDGGGDGGGDSLTEAPSAFCSATQPHALCIDFEQNSLTKGYLDGKLADDVAMVHEASLVALVPGVQVGKTAVQVRSVHDPDGGGVDPGVTCEGEGGTWRIGFDFEIVAAPTGGEVTIFRAFPVASLGPQPIHPPPPTDPQSLFLVLGQGGLSLSGRGEPQGDVYGGVVGMTFNAWHHVELRLSTYRAPDDPYSTLVSVDGMEILKGIFFGWGRTHLELGAFGASADGFELHFDNITMDRP